VDERSTVSGGAVVEPLDASSLRALWGAHLVSLTGRWMHAFALGWIVYDVTHSSLWLSLIAALGTAPLLPLGLLGGAIADRCDKARILFATQTAAMFLALITAVLVTNGPASPWWLALVSLAYGVVAAIDAPTLHAYLFEANGDSRTARVASLQSLIFNGTRIGAPALAAVAIAVAGAYVCFVVNAVSFLPLIVFLRRHWRRTMSSSDVPFAQTVRDSLDLPRGRPRVMRTLVQVVLINVFAVPCFAFLPALAIDLSDAGLWSLGLMTSSLGAGALIAAGGLQATPTVVASAWLRMPAVLALCTGLLGLAVAADPTVQAGWCLLAGAATAATLAHANHEVQAAADRTTRGRLAAWYLIALLGTAPFGHLVLGFLSASWGVPRTVQIAALVCGAAMLGAELLFACMRRKADARTARDLQAFHDRGLDCDSCLQLHKASENYCSGCHPFDFRVP
jgi:MFS family permease